MSKELNNITNEVMKKIHTGKIKARPKAYFIIGSLLTFLGLASSIAVSVSLFGLMRFLVRAHGPMGEYRLEQLLSNYPWWAPVFAILGLVVGIWLLRQYDFSYKIHFSVIIIGFIFATIVAGLLLDMSGINDEIIHRGPMKGVMQQYLQDNRMQLDGGWRYR